MLQPDIISLLCEITCAFLHIWGVHSILCLLLLSSVSRIAVRNSTHVDGHRFAYTDKDFHWAGSSSDHLYQQIRQTVCPTPCRAISSMGLLGSSPTTHHTLLCAVSQACLEGSWHSNFLNPFLFFFLFFLQVLTKPRPEVVQFWAAFKRQNDIIEFAAACRLPNPGQALETGLGPQ